MITVVTTIFIYVYKTKGALEARQTVTKESYFFLEKLQVMSKDYSIDYEEYRNRKQVWCTAPNNPVWSWTSHCTMMTYYWNRNNLHDVDYSLHQLYYCSTLSADWGTVWPVSNFASNSNCRDTAVAIWWVASSNVASWFIQSYGQYKNMFIDVKDDVDFVPWVIKDDDDTDLWIWPVAVYQTNTNYPQELYLISNDKQRKLLFRRKLKEQFDYNWDWIIKDSEKLYSIQVLQLRWFDAWVSHNFDTNSQWVYDWDIDTWACDYSLWFICNGASVSWAYVDFRMPSSGDDGWQDLLTNDITISKRNIVLSPLTDPNLSWADNESQVNPFFTINFTANLYGKNRNLKIPRNQMDQYSLKLQTTFSSMIN